MELLDTTNIVDVSADKKEKYYIKIFISIY